jgi:Mor family transcriptional regulator
MRNGGTAMELEEMQSLLPEIVCEIADLIGFDATQKLVFKFGGVTFPVGKGMRADGIQRYNMLRNTIGEDNAKTLSEHFAGELVYIPRCDAALREWRNQQFLVEFDYMLTQNVSANMALTKLCPKYKITVRHGWDILSRRKRVKVQQQQPLF